MLFILINIMINIRKYEMFHMYLNSWEHIMIRMNLTPGDMTALISCQIQGTWQASYHVRCKGLQP